MELGSLVCGTEVFVPMELRSLSCGTGVFVLRNRGLCSYETAVFVPVVSCGSVSCSFQSSLVMFVV